MITSIDEAKQYLKDNWEDGCACPACGQHVQLYDYKLFATSAYALLLLYKLDKEFPREIYFHISRYAEAGEGKIRSPHFAELRFWGLIAKRDAVAKDPTKKSSGYWCITAKGKSFIEGDITVPSRILVFNNKFRGFSDKAEQIAIRKAFDNKFDYTEIIKQIPLPLETKAVSWLHDDD